MEKADTENTAVLFEDKMLHCHEVGSDIVAFFELPDPCFYLLFDPGLHEAS